MNIAAMHRIMIPIMLIWMPAMSVAQEISSTTPAPRMETAPAPVPAVISQSVAIDSRDMQLADPTLKAEDVGLAQPGSSLRLSSLTD